MVVKMNEQTREDSKRIEDIRKRMGRAGVQPWKAVESEYGFDVIEPYACFGRYDVLIARGLDGATAAFLAAVPNDIKFLLCLADEAVERRAKKK